MSGGKCPTSRLTDGQSLGRRRTPAGFKMDTRPGLVRRGWWSRPPPSPIIGSLRQVMSAGDIASSLTRWTDVSTHRNVFALMEKLSNVLNREPFHTLDACLYILHINWTVRNRNRIRTDDLRVINAKIFPADCVDQHAICTNSAQACKMRVDGQEHLRGVLKHCLNVEMLNLINS